MAIIKSIINSAKKAWNGEEKLWKVFWLWGVGGYFLIISFLFLYSWSTFDQKNIAIPPLFLEVFLYCIFLTLVIPLGMVKLFNKNIKNINIKNKFLRKFSIFFLLFLFPMSFSVVNLIVLGTFLCAGMAFGEPKIPATLLILLFMSCIYLNCRFFKSFKTNINQ